MSSNNKISSNSHSKSINKILKGGMPSIAFVPQPLVKIHSRSDVKSKININNNNNNNNNRSF